VAVAMTAGDLRAEIHELMTQTDGFLDSTEPFRRPTSSMVL